MHKYIYSSASKGQEREFSREGQTGLRLAHKKFPAEHSCCRLLGGDPGEPGEPGGGAQYKLPKEGGPRLPFARAAAGSKQQKRQEGTGEDDSALQHMPPGPTVPKGSTSYTCAPRKTVMRCETNYIQLHS